MIFEEIFERVGEKVDKTIEDINRKVRKTSEEIKSKIEKSREDMSDEFIKKMNKLGERISPEHKDLSNFEKIAANIAIGIAHSLEEGYKKVKNNLFLTEKEKKNKYGVLGKVWSEKYVPRERAMASLEYVKVVDQKLLESPFKKEMLKDIVESLSSSNTELYGYYVYHHFTGTKRSKDHDEKKKIVKEILMSKEEREYYQNGKNKK